MTAVPNPNRGEIWLIDFDPAMGVEIRNVRPALVVSLDALGQIPLRIVVPITDWQPHYSVYPWFSKIPADVPNGLSQDSGADSLQTKSVALTRFVRAIGTVAPEQLEAVVSAIALCVGV